MGAWGVERPELLIYIYMPQMPDIHSSCQLKAGVGGSDILPYEHTVSHKSY